MRLSIAITKNATAVQSKLWVRNQITPPTIIAGRSMKSARRTATIKTTMINRMIIVIRSPLNVREFICSHLPLNEIRAILAFGVSAHNRFELETIDVSRGRFLTGPR